jgi:hypothetical protein
MKRFVLSAIVAAAALSLVSVTQAATATGSGAFDVTINLTPVCKITATPGAITFNYTADGGQATASSTTGVTCTKALPYTMALDGGAPVVGGVSTVYTYTDAVLEVQYKITLENGASGNAAERTHSISGSIAANQWGKCAGPSGTNCANTTNRTLTVSY